MGIFHLFDILHAKITHTLRKITDKLISSMDSSVNLWEFEPLSCDNLVLLSVIGIWMVSRTKHVMKWWLTSLAQYGDIGHTASCFLFPPSIHHVHVYNSTPRLVVWLIALPCLTSYLFTEEMNNFCRRWLISKVNQLLNSHTASHLILLNSFWSTLLN